MVTHRCMTILMTGSRNRIMQGPYAGLVWCKTHLISQFSDTPTGLIAKDIPGGIQVLLSSKNIKKTRFYLISIRSLYHLNLNQAEIREKSTRWYYGLVVSVTMWQKGMFLTHMSSLYCKLRLPPHVKHKLNKAWGVIQWVIALSSPNSSRVPTKEKVGIKQIIKWNK